ncbi:helix-turn-helix domain-containing protein [Nonomuraea monospora]|uniref:ArsR/SmtB family transcription factor n=1 Tax=Nonomuraea monospora TaxID=568818 RepID=UPI0031E22B62
MSSTGALARRVGTSSAAISQHTAVLRQAGLITTRRHRSHVLHHPTQTGLTLLNKTYFVKAVGLDNQSQNHQ